MKLTTVKVKKFRLLENVTINMSDSTTIIVGKNNSGKTSFTTIFNIFLNEKEFNFFDFSLAAYDEFFDVYKKYQETNNKEEFKDKFPSIQLYLTIEYSESDDWSLIKPFLTNLDDNNQISILCEYAPKSTIAFLKYLSNHPLNDKTVFLKEISENYQEHYQIKIRPYSESEEYNNVSYSDFSNLISAKFITAQRVLADSTSENTSKLSNVFHRQFDYKNKEDKNTRNSLLNSLNDANQNINEQLQEFFNEFIDIFSQFGFPGLGEEKVTLKSLLDIDNLFRNNIKLFYSLKDNHNQFPEKYNGLGYSNLIYIIAQIIDFKKQTNEFNKVNLIFIEEPEAHMHPQMQSVFIKEITEFLSKSQTTEFSSHYQTILTTHSSYILSNIEQQHLRYFLRETDKTIIKDLNTKFKINFLMKNIKSGVLDLFFTDKAILIEGTVERILLPSFIKKIEEENPEIKLSQQYIAIIEVGGAYAHKFKEVLKFLAIKTLVITDIDSVKEKIEGKRKIKTQVSSDSESGNPILTTWIPKKSDIMELLTLEDDKKIKGNIRVAYQKKVTDEPLKCGRSFEEAFIIDNNDYIFKNKNFLGSLKSCLDKIITGRNAKEKIYEIKERSYEIQAYIDENSKKTDFAFDLLTCFNKNKSWKIPTYIKEGLEWLAK